MAKKTESTKKDAKKKNSASNKYSKPTVTKVGDLNSKENPVWLATAESL